MDEQKFTRDKRKSHKREGTHKSSKEKGMGDKLKNETSAEESYRKKLRHKKADNQLTKDEKKKLKQKKDMNRRRLYAQVAATQKIREQVSEANEDENAGVNALTSGTEGIEVVSKKFRDDQYSRRLRKKNRMQKKSRGKKDTDMDMDREGSNPISKEYQKNRMKKEMINAAREKQAKETVNKTNPVLRRFTDKAEDMAGRLVEFIVESIQEHPGVMVTLVLLFLVIVLVAGSLSSCSVLSMGVQNVTVATSFTANNEEILAVEADYVAKETGLQNKINRIESDYPGYNEYKYSLAEINHNPYELAALLTVLYEDYTESEVQTMLQTIFDYQYTLTLTPVTETRYRTVTHRNPDGSTSTSQEPYDYKILNVTLTNNGIAAAVNALGLNADQMQRYTLQVQMMGNKPELFGDNPYARPEISADYRDYAIPGEYMTDQEFANIVHEAEKYLGYPYVWGGSSPDTSFDCSGFVSYVINHCGNGWSYGRLTAEGWRCATAAVHASDVKAGDLVFFQGTYATTGASHVGIVVDPARKIMIHCGNPIQYASYDTPYWRDHAYCYGRLP